MKRLVPRKMYDIGGTPLQSQFTLFKKDLFHAGVAVAINMTGAVTNGFTVSGATTTGILVSGAATTAISVTSDCTTGLQIGVDGTPAGDFIVYGDEEGSYIKYDTDMTGTNAGRLIVAGSSTRLTLSRSINECAFAIMQTHDTDDSEGETGGGHAMWATYTVHADSVLAADANSGYNHICSIHGRIIVSGDVNSNGMYIYGLLGGLEGAGTVTECVYVAGVVSKNNTAINPDTGTNCLFLGWNPSGVVDVGLLLKTATSMTTTTGILIDNDGTMVTGITIEACTTTGIAIGPSTSSISITDASGVTNFVIFNELSGCIAATDVDPKASPSEGGLGADGSIVIDVNGTPYYIPIFDTLVT